MNRAILVIPLVAAACGGGLEDVDFEQEPQPEEFESREQGLVTCETRQDTGYRSGNAFTITVVTADGYPVEKNTANAYAVMQAAAARDGVGIRINSGFRTQQEQQYLYSCYRNCNCNSCNLAAAPGYSNHQSGSALDLNTSVGAVFNWLNAHGGAYGFARTVPSEPWHWEYMGGGPGGGPCVDSCDRTAGPFAFSCDGPQPNMACVNVNEPADPNTWNDNFFCSAQDLGLRWSWAGDVAGFDCTPVTEAAEAQASAWSDNRLCAPPQSPWKFEWSSAGPLAGRSCVHWNEPSDPNSWHDNFFCASPRNDFTSGGFTFSMNGARPGLHCVSVDEPSDPDTWADNFFCSELDLGMRWSFAGPIAGMNCTNVAESAEALASIWADNYLCVPPSAPVRLTWSSAGQVPGLSCVRWFDHAERNPTWLDNWMCFEPVLPLLSVQEESQWLPVEPVTPVPTAPAPAPSSSRDAAAPEPTHMELESQGCSAVGTSPLFLLGLTLLRRRCTSKPGRVSSVG